VSTLRFRCFGALVLLLLAQCASPSCETSPTAVAKLPLTRWPVASQASLLVVPAGINGHWTRLIVDTGAEQSLLTANAAQRLLLRPTGKSPTYVTGAGSTAPVSDGKLDRLVLGGVHFPLTTIAVGPADLHAGIPQIDGLLGADILLAFDLDIDVAGGTLTLYRHRDCAEDRPPWPEPFIAIDNAAARKDRLELPIEIDGITGTAVLDTGAQHTVIGSAMAERLGLTQQVLAADPPMRQRGVGPNETVIHLHRFAEFRIGPIRQIAPLLPVSMSAEGRGETVLGEDFLQGRHVWLSFRGRRVDVTTRAGESRTTTLVDSAIRATLPP
jgi:hypothetical protein